MGRGGFIVKSIDTVEPVGDGLRGTECKGVGAKICAKELLSVVAKFSAETAICSILSPSTLCGSRGLTARG